MKQYSKKKDTELWYKQKSMGKKKFLLYTTLAFIACMIFLGIVFYLLAAYLNSLFGVFNYSLNQIILYLVAYIIAIASLGFIKSTSLWNKRKIRFEGITGIVDEIDDSELKNLILKGEKIMAVKRHKNITGTGLKNSIRYVNLITEYYSCK